MESVHTETANDAHTTTDITKEGQSGRMSATDREDALKSRSRRRKRGRAESGRGDVVANELASKMTAWKRRNAT